MPGTWTLTATSSTPSLQITPTSIPGVATGLQYSVAFSATGGNSAGYTWSLSSGSLPAGFTLTPAGLLVSSGSPPAASNSYSFWVQVTDSAGDVATQLLTLVISCSATVNQTPGGSSGSGLPTYLIASFVPENGNSIEDYATACGFTGFDWVQTITQWPNPSGLFAENSPTVPLVPPFADPPLGGYTYQFQDPLWLAYLPNFATSNPYYYSPLDLPAGCAAGNNAGQCELPVTSGATTLNFFDAPQSPACSPPASCIALQTQLVGICSVVSSTCPSVGPSPELSQWTWVTNFDGGNPGSGGIAEPGNILMPPSGAGTGGVAITSINGVPFPLQVPTVTVTASTQSVSTAQALNVSVAVAGGNGRPVPAGSLELTVGSYTSPSVALSEGGAIINLPAGSLTTGTYTLTVSYTPDSASSSIYYNSAGSTAIAVTVPLITPTVTVTPAALSITTAQALTVTVAVSSGNGSPTPTGSITLTSGGYTSATATLTSGSATINIPAGSLATGSDTLTATYTPDANSSSTYLTATGTSSAVTVTVPPSFAVAGTAVSVEPGATTGNTSSITITPSGGFTGPVALTATIGNSPVGAVEPPTLSFGTTTPVTINGASNGTATLTITSSAPTTQTCTSSLQMDRGAPWYTGGGAVLACALLFGGRTQRRRWRSILGMLLLFVALTGGVLACGGGGNKEVCNGAVTVGTTPGAYTITVTGTSGALTETGTVTLTVQ